MIARASFAAATVLGELLLAGGPRHAGPPPAERWPIEIAARGHVFERLHTGAHGAFRVALAPGSYVVTARQPFPPYRACDSRTLELARGATVHVQLTCNIK
jgi:hypothetical protein